MSDQTIENAVRMASKIYEMRDTAKSIYGDRYSEKSREYQAYIRAAMVKFKTDNALAAVPRMVKDAEANGGMFGDVAIMLLTAAAADIIDQEKKT